MSNQDKFLQKFPEAVIDARMLRGGPGVIIYLDRHKTNIIGKGMTEDKAWKDAKKRLKIK